MLQEHTYTYACLRLQGRKSKYEEGKKGRKKRDSFHSIYLMYTPSLLQGSAGDNLSIVRKEYVFQNRFPIGKHSIYPQKKGKMLPLEILGTKTAALIDPLAQNSWARFSKGKEEVSRLEFTQRQMA